MLYIFFYKQLGSGPSPRSCLTVTNFKCIPVVFQHSPLMYCTLLFKNQSSFYEIQSLAVCINIKAIYQVNRKQLIIMYQITFRELVAYKPDAYIKKCKSVVILIGHWNH